MTKIRVDITDYDYLDVSYDEALRTIGLATNCTFMFANEYHTAAIFSVPKARELAFCTIVDWTLFAQTQIIKGKKKK